MTAREITHNSLKSGVGAGGVRGVSGVGEKGDMQSSCGGILRVRGHLGSTHARSPRVVDGVAGVPPRGLPRVTTTGLRLNSNSII